jgi:hypothetical protein
MLDHVRKQHVELAPTMEELTGMFYLPHHVEKRNAKGRSNGEYFSTRHPAKVTAPP